MKVRFSVSLQLVAKTLAEAVGINMKGIGNSIITERFSRQVAGEFRKEMK